MFIIRPAKQLDLNAITRFPDDSLFGMTSLPRERNKLQKKIDHSEESFAKQVNAPAKEEYYFVMEDLAENTIVGTSGILADSIQSFHYLYQIETIKQTPSKLPTPQELKTLKIIPNQLNASEVCALYVQRSFRRSGLGRLLALSRFLFIAAFPHRFKQHIVAELRGYIDLEHQTCPFWEGIGQHFCKLTFSEVMTHFHELHDFTPSILPQHPLYICLLPQETQEVIGKTHDSTKPAYQMLVKENFTWNKQIDFIEGGAILTAETENIRTIKESRLVEAQLVVDQLDEEHDYLIGNERIDFRACMGKVKISESGKSFISQETAHALQISQGNLIRYVSLR